MKISRIPSFVTAVAALAAAAALGCTGTSPYMAPAAHSAVETAPEMATVVFARPSEIGGGADRVTIMDGKGRFLGDTLPGTYFAVKMPPGEHLFLSWGESVSPVKATVVGGKIYFVEAYSPTGPGTPRLSLRAVTLRSSNYGKTDEWMTHATPLAPAEATGQAYLQKEASGVQSAIAEGNKVFAAYNPTESAEHTLAAEDGK
jgi:hypothetical protein